MQPPGRTPRGCRCTPRSFQGTAGNEDEFVGIITKDFAILIWSRLSPHDKIAKPAAHGPIAAKGVALTRHLGSFPQPGLFVKLRFTVVHSGNQRLRAIADWNPWSSE